MRYDFTLGLDQVANLAFSYASGQDTIDTQFPGLLLQAGGEVDRITIKTDCAPGVAFFTGRNGPAVNSDAVFRHMAELSQED